MSPFGCICREKRRLKGIFGERKEESASLDGSVDMLANEPGFMMERQRSLMNGLSYSFIFTNGVFFFENLDRIVVEEQQ